MPQVRHVALLSEPIAEAGRREGLAQFRHEEVICPAALAAMIACKSVWTGTNTRRRS
jgi:hypothetical protein